MSVAFFCTIGDSSFAIYKIYRGEQPPDFFIIHSVRNGTEWRIKEILTKDDYETWYGEFYKLFQHSEPGEGGDLAAHALYRLVKAGGPLQIPEER